MIVVKLRGYQSLYRIRQVPDLAIRDLPISRTVLSKYTCGGYGTPLFTIEQYRFSGKSGSLNKAMGLREIR